MVRKLVMFSMAVAGVAMAQAPATVRAPSFKPGAPMACAAGAKQTKGAGGSMYGCASIVDGKTVFNGSVVRLYDNGAVESVGQLKNGLREGKWQVFTKDGALTAEVEFSNDHLNGRRIEYAANGSVLVDENYVMGKREGVQKMARPDGTLVSSTFAADRKVQ